MTEEEDVVSDAGDWYMEHAGQPVSAPAPRSVPPKVFEEPKVSEGSPTDIIVKVTIEYDYRMSDTWRQQTVEDIAKALLPLDRDEAFRFVIKQSTLQ